ncbi:Plasmodium exported protein (Pm-fam-a like), unknown function [Plasmodium ovale wallikeri]|uniref:Pv-fam-d protein n=2 Tax=Plasmodium ovale TaxID=36330 RepID=A0A1A9A8N5_PLAOA|nr:Plasmodium exported protein (Pm-fam-a like), unknown function [Plasmodium ovale wallikeri]SBT55578.1 Plasmodium exported protein (Pm-fam-a like), unknown function [Plasmodium ovale wallikeri]SBT75593.1 Plasmodium exported protein, unknown function [Plasmodium ovale]
MNFLTFIKIFTFVLLLWICQYYNNESNVRGNLDIIDNTDIILNARIPRLLAKDEVQKEGEGEGMKEKTIEESEDEEESEYEEESEEEEDFEEENEEENEAVKKEDEGEDESEEEDNISQSEEKSKIKEVEILEKEEKLHGKKTDEAEEEENAKSSGIEEDFKLERIKSKASVSDRVKSSKIFKKKLCSIFRPFKRMDAYIEKKLFKIFYYVDKCEINPNMNQKSFYIIKLKKYGTILSVPIIITLVGLLGLINPATYAVMFTFSNISFGILLYIMMKTLKYEISSRGKTKPGFKEYVASFKRCMS